MATAKRTLAAGVMVALLIASARPAAAQETLAAQVTLGLRNDARVPGDLLAAAQTAVIATFAKAGVAATFVDAEPCLTIVLLSRHTADKMGAIPDAVGFAPGSEIARGTIAYVLQPRVDAIADGYTTSRSVVLAAAIAHEVGHLLMFNAHSSTGIMRPTWNQTDFRQARLGNLLFSADQAAKMRAALTSNGAQ